MNLANTIRMLNEKRSDPPFDVSKADYAGAAKELTQYAKTKGGIDKNDFLAFANRMSAIANKKAPRVTAKFARDLMDLDTSPREKIVSVMRSNGIKVTVQGGGFKIEDFTLEELEELDALEEAKVMGREVHDKTFANRTQADNFAKKNGGRVRQVGRVFYVFKEEVKEAKEDEEPASPDEGKMAVKQAEFIQYVGREVAEYVKGKKEFPEWMQNKLSALHQKAKDVHATLGDHGDDEGEVSEGYKTPAEASAYEAGKKAVAKKVSYDDNPNKKGTKEYTAWSKGHNDARAKMIANRHVKEEDELDELSPATHKRYQDAAFKDAARGMAQKRMGTRSTKSAYDKEQKRYKGIDTSKYLNRKQHGVKEEVELDEARDPSKSGGSGYDLYHKDFSSAMKHAYDYAKKKFGIDIDPKEIDDKVASGPRKPSAGKTNSYRLKSKDGKKGVQIQVANLDNKKYELNMYKEEVELEETTMKLDEAREDTATQVARALKKMGVKPNAKEADIIKKIPGVLKKMGLENDKLIKRDPDFIGDVLDSMNEDIDIQEEQKISLEEAIMQAVLGEKKMDPVDKKALKKDYDDRAKDGDGDIDNDGDEDKTDKYLHKKRQAISKSVDKEDDAPKKKAPPQKGKKGNGVGEPVDTNPTMDEEVSPEVMKMVQRYGKSDEVSRLKRYGAETRGLTPDQIRDKNGIIARARAKAGMREEVERIMESFEPNRFAQYGDRAEQVMELTAIKMAEKKHK